MIVAYCTYCSKDKVATAHPLSAIERYQSQRIRYVYDLAQKDHRDFFILSGEFGLLTADQMIPYYDHLLLPSEVQDMRKQVEQQLTEQKIESIKFFIASIEDQATVLPYNQVIEQACANLHLGFSKITLENPYLD